jgi:hypothetical protein
MDAKLNIVPFVSVDHMMKLVNAIGVERFLTDLAAYVEGTSEGGSSSTRPRGSPPTARTASLS